jgi:RNA polymerase sigma-70 factor (sigma-E family)
VVVATDKSDVFAEFVALRSAALQRSAYLIVGDVGLAQDLVQEALTRTYLAWPRMRDPRRAEAYARKAITTTAIDWSRRRRWRAERAVPLPETAAGPVTPDHAGDVDERTWLWLCLLQLPIRQRAAIVLRYYEDLTERETAETMGCAIGTVKSQVAAGLSKLRPLVSEGLLPQEVHR